MQDRTRPTESRTARVTGGDAARGRLRLAPAGPATAAPIGHRAVVVDSEPVGLCYVPPTEAEWLVVLLHGAGGAAEDALRMLVRQADQRGLVLYAPTSMGPTWDVIRGGFGPDVWRIQRALTELRMPPRVAVGGFSDGASYALSLGLTNGDVFDAVLAFSPGFAAPAGQVGSPDIFISHGRSDRVLPIDRCSRRLVPALRRAGYRVQYHEFDGGHVVPDGIVEAALGHLGGGR